MATVLITAGPTREHLDAVRFLSNGSTGRMGYALAEAARQAGHRVLLVSGPSPLSPPAEVELHRVVAAAEMAAAVDRLLPEADLIFGAAAVADERPAERLAGKPAKSAGPRTLTLVPNPDIIAGVAARAGSRVVVGFALESPDDGGDAGVLRRGQAKLERKGLDAIAVNTTSALGAAVSEVVVLFAGGGSERLPRQSKAATAARLVEIGGELWHYKRQT